MEAWLHFFKVFTGQAQDGNGAACVLVSEWPEHNVLQRIAYQAQQAVTAFIRPCISGWDQYQIRWFSRQQEINLCGHGTLAAAALLRQSIGEGRYQFVRK